MKKFILLGAVFILLLSSNTVFSCVCFFVSNPTPESIRIERQKDFNRARLIFSGEVIKLDEFKAEFKIDKIWKGDSVNYVTMLTGTKVNEDGTYTSSSCDYSFELGRKYLIYAYGKLDELKTHSCSRSSFLKDAIEEIEGLEKITPHKDVNKLP